jgi:hypothetical protein
LRLQSSIVPLLKRLVLMDFLKEHSPTIFTIFGLLIHSLLVGLVLTFLLGGNLLTQCEIGPTWAIGLPLVNTQQ